MFGAIALTALVCVVVWLVGGPRLRSFVTGGSLTEEAGGGLFGGGSTGGSTGDHKSAHPGRFPTPGEPNNAAGVGAVGAAAAAEDAMVPPAPDVAYAEPGARPSEPLELPSSPTPGELAIEAALAVPEAPLPAGFMRERVRRYRAKLGPPPVIEPTVLLFDDLFPKVLRERLGLPVGTRILSLNGNPPGGLDTLDTAFAPAGSDPRRLVLLVVLPDGVVVRHEVALGL